MRFIPQFEPSIKKEYAEFVSKQIQTGIVGSHKITEEFEKKVSNLFGCDYGISTTSGTVALMMAIESLELLKCSTILFPAYTFLAGANACKFLGYNVRLVDIKEDTLSIDPEQLIEILDEIKEYEGMSLERRVTVMFVNHNGYHGEDLQEIKNICKKYNIKLIEDAAQSLGISYDIVGDVATTSFSVPKLITTGQGGMVLTNNQEIYKKCLQIRDHGDNWRQDRIHNNLGVNFKFNDILASFGMAQLNKIGEILLQRKIIFQEYRKYINLIDYGYESNWMVIYRSKKVQEIIKKLEENNIKAVQYYRPINQNPIYQTEKTFPIAEKVYNEIVYLPSSLNLTKEEIKRICEIIKDVEENN